MWQHEEETEDVLRGPAMWCSITLQLAGTVRKVGADDTDIVKKGDVLVAL